MKPLPNCAERISIFWTSGLNSNAAASMQSWTAFERSGFTSLMYSSALWLCFWKKKNIIRYHLVYWKWKILSTIVAANSKRHAVFPGGHPSKYWPRTTLLNYGDRTRTGVLTWYERWRQRQSNVRHTLPLWTIPEIVWKLQLSTIRVQCCLFGISSPQLQALFVLTRGLILKRNNISFVFYVILYNQGFGGNEKVW